MESSLSAVERYYLGRTDQSIRYSPEEKIDVLVIDSFPELGRLTALRFLEWVQVNPEGVVSLPTGKTPEYFIREVQEILAGWNRSETRGLLEQIGLSAKKPTLGGLRFVQIDEFYPINPLHHNSFYHYVNRFYIDGFGLDPKEVKKNPDIAFQTYRDKSKNGVPTKTVPKSSAPVKDIILKKFHQ